MSPRKTTNGFRPPPHANAKIHRKIMAELRKMTSEEIFQTWVEAGIYYPDGKLNKHYSRTDDVPIR